MPISRDRLHSLSRFLLACANVLVVIALIATAVLIKMESGWVHPATRGTQDAFRHGTIGTELMPVPVALVLPEMFPEHFQPAGTNAGDWVEQYGFLHNSDPKTSNGLPIGFAVSNYRPASAAPSPVPFVGFTCALCHSTEIRKSNDQSGVIVYGPGSASLNLFAWIDAFKAAMLTRDPPPEGADPNAPAPYRMTLASVSKAYEEKTGDKLGPLQRMIIWAWLRQIRDRIKAALPRFDDPIGNGKSRDPEVTPTGPTRTRPFQTLIRRVLDRPGSNMAVYTKIATVFSEDMRPRAQFDGSISDFYARSSLAAFAAGATITNMANPEIADDIRKATDFTMTLRPPRFEDLFPAVAATRDPAAVERGHAVYTQYCAGCHGDRDAATGTWVDGPKTGQVIPVSALKTDPERVMFRHYDELAGRMYELFPDDHPFHFARRDIWPHPGDEENLSLRGYVAAPLDGMFLRAPYLHNASVLTLAELINLKKRRDVFYRGTNTYDPIDAGFRSAPGAGNYFTFDATLAGNSNKGHDYPWAYDDPRRDPNDLAALLEYLKTL
jgi:cytochrome c5